MTFPGVGLVLSDIDLYLLVLLHINRKMQILDCVIKLYSSLDKHIASCLCLKYLLIGISGNIISVCKPLTLCVNINLGYVFILIIKHTLSFKRVKILVYC